MSKDLLKYHLSNSPIIEASVEIYCTFNIPNDAVIGVIYTTLTEHKIAIKALNKLPICNIPEEIRKSDINLRDKPTHQFICDEGVILVGNNTLSFGVLPPYKSWITFQSFIKKVIKYIRDAQIIKGLSRISIKYLNFFKDNNIFDNINLKISLNNNIINNPSTVFKTEIITKSDSIIVLQITNGVHVKNQLLKLDNNGSLLDLNVVSKKISLDTLETVIENAHTEAKELFFKLLKSDFVKEFM